MYKLGIGSITLCINTQKNGFHLFGNEENLLIGEKLVSSLHARGSSQDYNLPFSFELKSIKRGCLLVEVEIFLDMSLLVAGTADTIKFIEDYTNIEKGLIEIFKGIKTISNPNTNKEYSTCIFRNDLFLAHELDQSFNDPCKKNNLKDEKYNCAFHEVGHAVMAKNTRPDSRIEISIELAQRPTGDTWVGKINEPEYNGQQIQRDTFVLVSEAQIAIAGSVAESIFKENNIDIGYLLLTKNKELENDFDVFSHMHALLRNQLIEQLGLDNDSQKKFFEYLYKRNEIQFSKYGIDKMHFLSEILCENELVIIG